MPELHKNTWQEKTNITDKSQNIVAHKEGDNTYRNSIKHSTLGENRII